jgi:hypothetical protein
VSWLALQGNPFLCCRIFHILVFDGHSEAFSVGKHHMQHLVVAASIELMEYSKYHSLPMGKTGPRENPRPETAERYEQES